MCLFQIFYPPPKSINTSILFYKYTYLSVFKSKNRVKWTSQFFYQDLFYGFSGTLIAITNHHDKATHKRKHLMVFQRVWVHDSITEARGQADRLGLTFDPQLLNREKANWFGGLESPHDRAPNLPPKVPPPKDHIFKCMNLWGPFSFMLSQMEKLRMVRKSKINFMLYDWQITHSQISGIMLASGIRKWA